MKTFEEWRKGKMIDAVGEAYDAWQACAAEYQPQLDKAEQIASTLQVDFDAHRGGFAIELKRLKADKVALESIIDEAQKALAAWEHWYSVDSTEFNRDNARDQGLDVLDRSGARGGSVAASPAPSPDNPPTNTDRSRT